VRFITPVNPISASFDFFNDIDDKYICDTKIEGFRLIASKVNGKLILRSKKNLSYNNISKDVFDRLFDIIPEGCELDCEHINKIRIAAINSQYGLSLPMFEKVIVFDVRWFNNCYLHNVSLSDRRKISVYSSLPVMNTDFCSNNLVESVYFVDGSVGRSLFDKYVNSYIIEGVVIKKKLGDISSKWFKIKYR